MLSNKEILQSNMITAIDSMMNRKQVAVHHNGVMHIGVVNQIEAEDGSGHNYNILLNNSPKFFVNMASHVRVWNVE